MADTNSEILALLAESMRAADRDREENMHRFERLIDHLGRVDHLTGQVKERQADLRLTHVEAAQQPTSAELDVRLRAVEEQLRKAS
jgi:hypothetical protein